MKLITIVATFLYAVDILHADYFLRPGPSTSYSPSNSKKFSRAKHYRYAEGKRDVAGDVEVGMIQEDDKKSKDKENNKKGKNGKKKKGQQGLTTELVQIEETEAIDDLYHVSSENPVCARLQKECYEACEDKRDMCEEWRRIDPLE